MYFPKKLPLTYFELNLYCALSSNFMKLLTYSEKFDEKKGSLLCDLIKCTEHLIGQGEDLLSFVLLTNAVL